MDSAVDAVSVFSDDTALGFRWRVLGTGAATGTPLLSVGGGGLGERFLRVVFGASMPLLVIKSWFGGLVECFLRVVFGALLSLLAVESWSGCLGLGERFLLVGLGAQSSLGVLTLSVFGSRFLRVLGSGAGSASAIVLKGVSPVGSGFNALLVFLGDWSSEFCLAAFADVLGTVLHEKSTAIAVTM